MTDFHKPLLINSAFLKTLINGRNTLFRGITALILSYLSSSIIHFPNGVLVPTNFYRIILKPINSLELGILTVNTAKLLKSSINNSLAAPMTSESVMGS